MCEIPSNVILAKEFSQIFDGFSIGSNDLTQLTLGVDRDSALVSHIYNERNLAVKTLIRQVIQVAHAAKRKVGICGQAPSDYPEFAEFLVQEGIDSISLNPDTVLKTKERIARMEEKLGKKKDVFNTTSATKALTVLGVAGLTFMLAGYGCEAVSYRQNADDIKQAVTEQLGQFKVEWQQELKKIGEEKRDEYKEEGFANFTLKYPSDWKINHWEEGVRFTSPDGKDFLHIFVQKIGHPVGLENISTTTFFGYPANRLQDSSQKGDDADRVFDILEVKFAKATDDNNGVIEITSNAGKLDERLKDILEFKAK
jgi:pyruvate,water dikinase